MDLFNIVRDKIILIEEFCNRWLGYEEIDWSELPDLLKDLIMDYKRQLDWKELNVEYHQMVVIILRELKLRNEFPRIIDKIE